MKNNAVRILLAEDDENLGSLLVSYLDIKGYDTELALNGIEAVEKFNEGMFHFVILDVMMPEKDGFAVAEEIREIDKEVPILFLTAKSLREDKLRGFAVGADDYLAKPFSMEELLARMEAILKRTNKINEQTISVFQIGKFVFDSQKRTISSNDTSTVKLTTKENQLLKLLAKNMHKVVDRQVALRTIWGDDNYFNGRSMDVYIAKIRKILKPDERIEVMNVHGKGFKLLD